MWLLKNKLLLIFLLLFPFFLLLWWFKDGLIKGVGESGLPFYNIAKEYLHASYTWSPNALGNSTYTTTSGNYFYGFFSLLNGLGLPAYLQQFTFFYLAFVLSGIGIVNLCKFLSPQIGKKYVILAILFYWFNPIVAFNIWNRFLNNFIVFWAILPIAFCLFIEGLVKRSFLILLPLNVFLFVGAYAFSSLALVLNMYVLFSFATLGMILVRKDLKYLFFAVKYFLLSVVLFALSNFWWISQIFSFSASSNYNSVVSNFFSPDGNLAILTDTSSRLGNFVSVFRLIHEDFANGLSWASVYKFFPVNILSFLPVALIIVWSLSREVKEIYKVLIFVFIVLLFLAKGSNPPFGESFTVLFNQFSVMQVFRNPFEKFSLVLILPTVILSVIAVNEISFGRIISEVSYLIFFILILVYIYPFISGNVLSSNAGFRDGITDDYSVKVPDYYDEANKFLYENANYQRTLVLPLGGEGMTYTWDYPYSGVELSNAIFDTPVISFNTTIPYYYEIVKSIENYQNQEIFLSALRYLNVKYILIREDIDYELRGLVNPEVLKENIEKLIGEGKIKPVFNAGKIKIYELNEDYSLPKFYIAENVIKSNSEDLVLIENAFGRNEFRNSYLSYEDNFGSNYDLIFPEKDSYLYDKDQILDFRFFSDDDILARLFHVEHLHNSFFYPFVRYKELFELYLQKDSDSKAIFKIGLLGKRAVEIYKLKMLDSLNDDILGKAEKDYRLLFYELLPIFKSNYEGTPLSGLIRQSLSLHIELFDRIDSPLADELRRSFIDLIVKKPKYLVEQENKFYVYKFNVSSKGEYNILGVAKSDKVYLNGSLIDVEKSVYFEEEEYEIAVASEERENIALLKNNELPQKTSTLIMDYIYINPTEYKVRISKKDNEQEILVFSELFDSRWHVYYHDNELIDTKKHLKVNIYANAWIIDRAGEYEIKVIYTPQKILEIGKKISLITVTGLLMIYLFVKIKKRRHVN
ncbi:MAG: alpha-(1-_3)-arabinofuranosyltransferase family protein [Patescibacteria group bacterium]|nr:alpha-(1->3)-arabinofuranosyltransferase family protein [Patescibacteria group bacterium]